VASSEGAAAAASGADDPAKARQEITKLLRESVASGDKAGLMSAIQKAEAANLSHEASLGRRQLAKLG
jgi:hypothetical protein